jgi:protein involved in polysaccharide export with SLBB domain
MSQKEFIARTVCLRRSRRHALHIGLILLLGLPCSAAQAQDQQAVQAPPSELGQENMSLVAASPADIKAVLVTDPGLMVELKQWVANDATNHGQIIKETDLTDDAIYDRLETDVKFRSVATRLLQLYGYLAPKVNPESILGKEQDLLIQERVKWLAQDQEQELAAAHQRDESATLALQSACNPPLVAGCNAPASRMNPAQAPGLQRQTVPSGSTIPSDQQRAPNSSPRTVGSLEQARLLQNDEQSGAGLFPPLLDEGYNTGQFLGDTSAAGLASSRSASLASSSAGTNPFGALTPQAASAVNPLFDSWLGQMGAGDLNIIQDTGANMQSLPGTNEFPTDLNELGGGGAGTSMLNRQAASEALLERRYDAQLKPVELTRAPDPYNGIPSLYDMYLQATPRPQTPRRFGLDIFENGTRDPNLIPMDLPAGPNYVVGPGDGLAIDLWGGVSQRLYRLVDREGRVSLPEVGPVLVSGKSLADVQQNLQQALRTQFRDVSVDVSLSRLRTIRVYVVGDVVNPGAYDISSLSTPLNALFAAGGPTPQGSLRIVKHYRGSQLVQVVDLYDLLLHGVRSDMERLENGDTVLVPPIGPQVTVEGMVRRPAIYELKDEKDLASVLNLAGGLLPTAALQHIEVQRIVAHEKATMISLTIPQQDDGTQLAEQLSSFPVHDGDQVRIFPIAPYNQNAVYLEGHVSRPGKYSYHEGMHVTDLLSSYKDLLPEPATQYAEIIRLNAPDFRPSVEGFNLAEALADPARSPVLHAMDTVQVFSRFDFENPPTVSVWGDVRGPGTFRTAGELRLSDAIHLAGGLAPDAQTGDAQVFRYQADGKLKIFSVNLSQALAGDPTQNIVLAPRDRVLVHRSPDDDQPAVVYIQGAVGKPGRYPLATNMTVADLIRIGGGLAPSADTHLADLTRYRWINGTKLSGEHDPIAIPEALRGDPAADVALHNGDVVTIRQLSGWSDLGASITVRGEVNHPGTYGIRPGERLSSILERTGGFRPGAYPYGAILQRTEVRELEAKQQQQLVLRVKDMETNLELLPDTSAKDKQAKETALAQYQTTLTELTTDAPVGRVTIRISSDIRRWKGTAADVEVRAGDRLFIPKRPSYVMVTGQVFDPTAVSYRPGRSAKWYLSQAGGPTALANKKAIFVIRADGSVVGAKRSLWGGESLGATLEPGDTVVVPERAIGGGTNWQNLFTSAQVASSIASTVFIALRY